MQLLHVLKDSKVSKVYRVFFAHVIMYALHFLQLDYVLQKWCLSGEAIRVAMTYCTEFMVVFLHRVQHLVIFMLVHIIHHSPSTMRQQ